MVIASIDLQGGKVVQLRQGAELVLEQDNAQELIKEFDRYGEVAIIDLDAAMGKGSNTELIKTLLGKAECRVGGGIRSAEQAKELISLGARKIIIGSLAFRVPEKKGIGKENGEFALNKPFLEALVKAIGRERIIIAVDARAAFSGDVQSTSLRSRPEGTHARTISGGDGYEITIDGWKTPTGLPLIDAAKEAIIYASELLFTCVDREGTLSGIDMEPLKQLCDAIALSSNETRITAAGGVTTLEEIEELAALNCDVQLGMALYTGRINLADAFVSSLNWKKTADFSGELMPLIAQSTDGQVLMTGYTNQQALSETFKRGKLCFYSRTQNKLWMKGEQSGNTLELIRLRADCDRDALLAIVKPAGSVCHTGAWSCFGLNRQYSLEYLQSVITERFNNPKPGSYTATLDDKLVREKIMEEAEELCTAETHSEKVWEAADLFYFATALITRENISITEVLNELDRRHKK